jgi:hypothetical protein
VSCIDLENDKGGECGCKDKIDNRIHRDDRILLNSKDSATLGPLGIERVCVSALSKRAAKSMF